ncbi:MerR family transcriptional regulator [Microvirga aerilata]|uniref:MerR family transcriptional regulator n=1 Tax=Microvirga aerilata TaxID=670292 RepID=UPI003640EF9C
MDKSPDAFRTISEVAEDLDVPQHVLRFWETRFSHIKPLKRGGGRRYYRPDDVDLLKGIRHLLYGEGYTIKGVQRILKEEGVRFVHAVGRGSRASPRCIPKARVPRRRRQRALQSSHSSMRPTRLPSHAGRACRKKRFAACRRPSTSCSSAIAF